MKFSNVFIPIIATCLLSLVGCSDNDKKYYSQENRLPTSTAASFETQADIAIDGQVEGADEDSDPLTYAAITQPTNGTLAFESDGSFTYTPAATFTGMDEFTFNVSDGTATSQSATVMITVNPQEVAFSTFSRAAFAQAPTDEPLPVKGRLIEQDVMEENAYDDLLTDN